jgi:hypothetical protein
MYRFASELTTALDDLHAHVTLALQTDTSPAAVSASGAVLDQLQRAKGLCRSICDAALKESPLAVMASPKKSKGVHEVVKAAYQPSPPRPEDELVRASCCCTF